MIETILFVILSYVLLWPYFVALGVMNFKKDPNAMEDHLPGRPARRTIGRKNDDMSKAIVYILFGYVMVILSFYGLLDLKDFLPSFALGLVGFTGLVIAMFLFSPANRLAHAYVTLGHIAVIHLICSICAGLLIVTIQYGYAMTLDHFIGLASIEIGAMLCFLSKPWKVVKKSKDKDDA